MSKKAKSRLLRYGITTAVGLLMVWAVLAIQEYGEAATTVDRMLILCNAFCVPGVLLILVAGLVFVSNNGALDGLSFVFSRAVGFLIPGAMTNSKHERYGDYVVRRRGKPKPKYGFLFFTGLAFLAVGLVFMAIFYQLY